MQLAILMGLATDRHGAKRRVVLLVDDDVDILESLRGLIEGSFQDVTVRLATSGAEALLALGGGSVDVIVADYRMPGMDGIELLQRARRASPKASTVLFTAFPDADVARRAFAAGAAFFVPKLLPPDRFVDVVGSLLERRAPVDVAMAPGLLRNPDFRPGS